MITEKIHETETKKTEQIKENVNSISGFFSLSYAIILIASISYNVGYFKYINPQIVDLMTLSDYINNTIHNVWVFFIPVILFYSGSLAYLKKRMGENFWQLIVFGITVLVISSFTFLKGISKEKIWPIFKTFLGETNANLAIISAIILITALSAYFIYRFSKAFLKDRLPKYAVSFFPIFSFILLVFIPYVLGSTQGQMENGSIEVSKYQCHTISIMTSDRKVIDNIYILKHIDKGLIIKNLTNQEIQNTFFFLSWNEIFRIIYHSDICPIKTNNTTS